MTGSEPEGGVANRDEPVADAVEVGAADVRRPGPWANAQGLAGRNVSRDRTPRGAGSKPIVWRWWLLAALLSLALWAGIIALVT